MGRKLLKNYRNGQVSLVGKEQNQSTSQEKVAIVNFLMGQSLMYHKMSSSILPNSLVQVQVTVITSSLASLFHMLPLSLLSEVIFSFPFTAQLHLSWVGQKT